MTTGEIYHEFQRRGHKLLGAYMVFWAWKKEVDCVVPLRDPLLSYLKLEDTPRPERIERLKADLKGLFQYCDVVCFENGYETLYFSRFPLPIVYEQPDTSTVFKWVEWLAKKSLKATIVTIPTESEIIRVMAEFSHGISDFSEW